MSLLVLFTSCALVVSFLCSLLEATILSVPTASIAVGIERNKKAWHLVGRLKQEIDRPLAAILTLNTLANVGCAAGVGAQIEQLFGSDYLAIGSALLALMILFFSEIIPKILGASHAKFLAPFAAYAIQFFIYITYPFVILSELLSDFFSAGKPHRISREEMIMTATISAQHGALDKKELSIIKNLLLLNNMYVSDIMTPRSVLFAIDKEMTVEDVVKKYVPIRFSRIPVYGKDLDNIEGMVLRYKLLEASSKDQHKMKVSELMTPISTLNENETVAKALDSFIKTKSHLFLVLDEYGTTTGIVTLEDAIETLLGVEIVDEFDSVADLRQYALEQWQQRKSKIRRIE